jgi:hypothetical protein
MVSNDRHMAKASSPQTKTPARTLIRVRNNQRRHRERRRQYIASLEQKVLETERHLIRALADIATLKGELERSQQGSNESKQDSGDVRHVKASSPAERGQKQWWEIFELQETSSAPQEFESCASGTFAATRRLSASATSQPTRNSIATPSSLQTVLLSQQLDASTLTHPDDPFNRNQGVFPPQCCSAVKESAYAKATLLGTIMPMSLTSKSGEWTLSASSCNEYLPPSGQSTTPCVQAYIFVSQLNFRGLDLDTITSWLHPGFRRPSLPNEGCQVESTLLFELLDYISGV